jgi:hypothetical protein
MNNTKRAKARRSERTAVEAYRVRPGRIALTFDFEGDPPYTVEINASSLADVVESLGQRLAGWSFQNVCFALGAMHDAHPKGQPVADHGMIIGYWLVLNHPISGEAMRRKIADRMAAGEPVHISLFASRSGGIALGLSDRFVDLSRAAGLVKAAGGGVVTLEALDAVGQRRSVQ